MQEAPVHLAVFCDETTGQGLGLGRKTMPETLRYSAVIAVHTLWLAARARGLGLGWVSILDPAAARDSLDVPGTWAFVAYLCIGWPIEDNAQPELQQRGWQSREAACRQVVRR
jgi:5,6-dimethylbenzimidazole synthase